ncbi:MAG: TolC family protein [Candidatus Omnitrophota bacterium]
MKAAEQIDMRERIIDAAISVAAHSGFTGATTQEMAKKAHCSEGIIYHYFKSKDELFLEVIRENAEAFLGQMRGRVERAGSAREKLETIIDFHFQYFTGKSHIFQILFGKTGDAIVPFPYLLKVFILPYQNLIEGVIREGIGSGAFQKANPSVVSASIIGTMQFNIIKIHFGVNEAVLDEVRSAVKHFIFKALKAVAFLFFSFSIVSSGSCEPVQSASGHSLSLDEAVYLAFNNNKNIQMQEREVAVAKAGISDARSRFLPTVGVSSAYTHNGSVLQIPSISSPFLPRTTYKKDIGIFTGHTNDFQFGTSVHQPIYNGGADIANFKRSEVELKVQEESLLAVKLDVEFEARRLYYGLLLAYETERITQELVGQARSHYEDVKNKFDQGTSSRFDVLQSKVQVSRLMPELVRAQNAIELITADLKKLLGLKMRDPVKLEGKLEYSALEIKEDEFLKAAYLNKPEMVLTALGIDISKWSIQMAKAGNRLQVSADAGYSYRSNRPGDMFNTRHNNWDAGITVSLPVFDGYSTKAKVDQARARYEQAVLAKEDLGEQIAVDIRKACLDLKQAQAIIESQKDNIEEAREALKISEVSYDNGEGTNLDVLDSQVSLSQVQKNLSEGVYDYLMAKAFLDRTMGQGGK